MIIPESDWEREYYIELLCLQPREWLERRAKGHVVGVRRSIRDYPVDIVREALRRYDEPEQVANRRYMEECR